MEPIQIGNILIDEERLAKVDQSRIVASIAREIFLSGDISVQRVCARPVILTLIAGGMIVLGALTARGLVYWLFDGGTALIRSIMMILLLPGGLYFLREAWRRAPMLIIETRRGMQRMEFKGERTKESITALTRAAQERGYTLRSGPGEWL
jgi:hypothetical protein